MAYPTLRLASFLILGQAALSFGEPAHAAACGEQIGPGGKVVLESDVGPCTSATSPALRVVGPVTLDMAGFRVLCDLGDRPNGVLVEGKKAKVRNGSADGCITGLDLTGGDGGHTIENFAVTRSDTDGVAINSDKSRLKRVTSTTSNDDGFDVDGDGNRIEDAEAVTNGGEGFEIGGDGNRLSRILGAANDEDGIAILGDGNQLKDGRFVLNGDDGVDVDGDENKIDKVLSSGNGNGGSGDTGIEVDGDDNRLSKLTVLDNDPGGILLTSDADGNTVKQSRSFGHGSGDATDDNAACGTNRWQKNRFGSTDADGQDDPECIPTKRGNDTFACGEIIGPKAKVTLGDDIELCDSSTNPALTIVGPATVDMAGFRVRCDPSDRPDGIVLEGKGVKLLNGGVTDCNDGLEIRGDGKHRVDGFASEGNDNDGTRVFSDKNRIVRFSGNQNGGDGVELDGSGNKVEESVGLENEGQGFEIDTSKNQLKRITGGGNTQEGLLVSDEDATSNRISFGAFVWNEDDGVELLTGGNKVEKSVAVRNGTDDQDSGFDSRADNAPDTPNQLKSNRASAHPYAGMRTNRDNDGIQKNVLLGNGTDALDENADCSGNKWKKNVFGTSRAGVEDDPECID